MSGKSIETCCQEQAPTPSGEIAPAARTQKPERTSKPVNPLLLIVPCNLLPSFRCVATQRLAPRRGCRCSALIPPHTWSARPQIMPECLRTKRSYSSTNRRPRIDRPFNQGLFRQLTRLHNDQAQSALRKARHFNSRELTAGKLGRESGQVSERRDGRVRLVTGTACSSSPRREGAGRANHRSDRCSARWSRQCQISPWRGAKLVRPALAQNAPGIALSQALIARFAAATDVLVAYRAIKEPERTGSRRGGDTYSVIADEESALRVLRSPLGWPNPWKVAAGSRNPSTSCRPTERIAAISHSNSRLLHLQGGPTCQALRRNTVASSRPRAPPVMPEA